VVKANAYGHGAVKLAKKMEAERAVDYFGIAQLQEGIELREAGTEKPILIFNSTKIEGISPAIKNQITMSVFSENYAQAIVKKAEELEKKAYVHLKIDSGMGRIGLRNFQDAYEVYQILDSKFVEVEGIYTHFADANDKSPENFSHEQFNHFQAILDQFEEKSIDFEIKHACNTAGTINYPEYHLDMVRVGIGLYGFSSVEKEETIELHPIQNIEAVVTHVKDFPAGQSIGYNRHYFSKKEMRVATIAIGYADGVPKALSNKSHFRYQGEKLKIVGDVCMDQIMLDCSEIPELKVGDSLSYFGDPAEGYSSASDIAAMIDSSNYELLCRIGERVEKIYQ
ncbi:MAG: alanine racemase, partial [Staphylococcus equorum]|nr:alanine racemase [Staphylococcus equorum]